MVLAMSRPHRHPKTGMYWLRKRVPKDVAAAAGRSMEYFSLKTRDAEEAKRRHAEELLKLEARWANLRAGPFTLSERQAHEIAAEVHDEWLAEFRDYPSRQTFWRTDLGADLWRIYVDPHAPLLERTAQLLREPDRQGAAKARLRQWCAEQAGLLIERRGLVTDKAGRRELAMAVAAAVQRASQTLERMARGEGVGLSPPMVQRQAASPGPAVSGEPPLSFSALFEAYAAERGLPPRTRYEWPRVLKQLSAFIGHDDVRRLTPDDLLRWKDKLVADGLSPKTIRDSNLASIRAVLKWGVQNRRLPTNPADGVTIRLKKDAGQGIRGFTDAEATTILRAAEAEQDPVKRWVPWVCAFSGARLSEVCQLRVQDISEVEGIAVMRFDAEAGSLKNTGSERTVPLHSSLIAAGFLDFVRNCEPGPVFQDLSPDKFGKRGGNGTKLLGRWVRRLGLTDARLAPNHSWRHRFKTLARKHGLAPDIADAITGHAHSSVGDRYGEYEVRAMKREIEKIPPVKMS
ncbi:site-specific integrase [Methylobacterium durans]|uniref:site-specific integrase n=1 Tax=Methylobacterium durans TaxID=2202825 RepID=UPI002AFE1D64|nr:site-specific integrase [Methylobacterium durans]MEA1831277.1 site-specific integrase [Methylobacterium durans]